MSVREVRRRIGPLIFATGMLSMAGVANAAWYVQSVTNDTGMPANDISVSWPSAVSGVMVQDPTKTQFPATVQDPPTNKVWAVNQTQGMNVPAGGTANVTWQFNFPVQGISGGNWTQNGANIGPIKPGKGGNVIGNPTKVMAPAPMAQPKKMGFFFPNNDVDPIQYTNVNVWIDNNISDYTESAFDVSPTGTEVETGGSFTVSPGNTTEQDFTISDETGYELVEADVTEDGTTTYTESAVSYAEAVPEPATIGLIVTAASVLALRRSRRVGANA
jgi:hypothetical protein